MNKEELESLLDREGNKDPDKATDLRGKALLRARDDKTPRTMTPYEWLEYYETHGIPAEHQQKEAKKKFLATYKKPFQQALND
jgi:hypothetical protein